MNTPQGGSSSTPGQRKKLPVNPSLEHLQKQAKRRVKQNPSLKLAEAQHQLAKEYGCENWAGLTRIVTSMAQRHDSAAPTPREFGPLPKAARAVEIGVIREVLAGGDFTQHDLDQALAHALWYEEKGSWQDRKAIADLLVEHGADPDGQYGSGGYGPIVFGTGECLNPAGLQYLIDAGADVTFGPVETKYGRQCPLSYWLGTYARGHNDRKHQGIEILLAHGAYVPPELHPSILAIHRGDTETLARLIDADPSLPRRHFDDMLYGNMKLDGATLLHCAVEFGEIACIDLLLDRWMEPNVHARVINGIGGQTPIYHAIAAGNLPALEHLVRRLGYAIECHRVRATFQVADTVYRTPMTPIEYAEKMSSDDVPVWRRASARELELVRLVVWPGIARKEESEKTPRQRFQEAARAADFDTVKRLVESGEIGPDELHHGLEGCALSGRADIARYLIDHGADINADYIDNYGPVLLGFCEGLDDDAVKFVLDLGAKADWEPRATKYPHHSTPLRMACETYVRGRNEAKHRILAMLVEHGARPDFDAPVFAIHRGDAAGLDRLLAADPRLARKTFPGFLPPLAGATLLHLAVEHNEIGCCETLFKHGADINARSDVIDGIGGQTPIFQAARSWLGAGYPTLEFLIRRAGQWIDTSIVATLKEDEKTVRKNVLEWAGERERKLLEPLDRHFQLRALISQNQLDAARRLLDECPELLTPALWPPAIFEAKSLEMTRFLLERGLNPNECSAPRKPVHFAVDLGRPDILKELLAAGADPNVTDGEGYTPLDLYGGLARNSDPAIKSEIVSLLCDAGARIDVWTSLRIGDTDNALKQLEADPTLVHKQSPDLGFLPLHVAARMGDARTVQWLLEHGADVNAGENTALWFACQSGASAANRIKVARMLLDAGADVNRRCEEGSTALHYAAWRGTVEMVELLRSRGARNWLPDDLGRTALEAAKENSVAADKEEIIKLLSQPRITDANFRAAVDAMTAGDLEKLRGLLRAHPYLATAQAEENGEFAGPYFARPYLLEFVAENPVRTGKLPANVCEIAQEIIDAGSPQAALDKTLALAASGRVPRECGLQMELLELLVKNGADASVGLEGAVSQGESGAVAVLLRLGAVPGLGAAAGLGDARRVRELAAGSSQREKQKALDAAFRHNQIETAEALLQSGLAINEEILDFGTPLHHAACYGHRKVCELLLRAGADPTRKDSQWQGTPAGWAGHNGHPELAAMLQDAEGKFIDQQVVRAVLDGDLSALKKLLGSHPEKLALTGGPWNKPLLHCAAWEGHLEIVRELVKRGADVNARCESDQACAIHFAAERGHLEIVKFLVESGSVIEAGDNDHRLNVLGWATSLGGYQEGVAHFLLSRGARQSIWSAIALNDTEVVRTLVAADPGLVRAQMSRNEYFRSPLHHAVLRNRPAMVRLLLELGADPNVRDAMDLSVLGVGNEDTDPEILALLEQHVGPRNLHDALTLGRFDEAEKILAKDPACIKQGGSETRLFVYAVCRKNWETAEWLLDHGADINAITEVYQCPATALHFAIETAPIERIRWLLEQGADTTIPDGTHNSDALGWAEFFGRPDIVELIKISRESKKK